MYMYRVSMYIIINLLLLIFVTCCNNSHRIRVVQSFNNDFSPMQNTFCSVNMQNLTSLNISMKKCSKIDTGISCSANYVYWQVFTTHILTGKIIDRLNNTNGLNSDIERIEEVYMNTDLTQAFTSKPKAPICESDVYSPIYRFVHPTWTGIDGYIVNPLDASVSYLKIIGRCKIMGGYVDDTRFKYVILRNKKYYLVNGIKSHGEQSHIINPDKIAPDSVYWLPLELEKVIPKVTDDRGLSTGYCKIMVSGDITLIYTWNPSCLIVVNNENATYYALDQYIRDRLPSAFNGLVLPELAVAVKDDKIYCIMRDYLTTHDQVANNQKYYITSINLDKQTGTINDVRITGAFYSEGTAYYTCNIYNDTLVILTWPGLGMTQKVILIKI